LGSENGRVGSAASSSEGAAVGGGATTVSGCDGCGETARIGGTPSNVGVPTAGFAGDDSLPAATGGGFVAPGRRGSVGIGGGGGRTGRSLEGGSAIDDSSYQGLLAFRHCRQVRLTRTPTHGAIRIGLFDREIASQLLFFEMTATARAVPRAVCVTSSPTLRRALRRTLGAAGSQVEFHDSVDSAPTADATLLVIDQTVRRSLTQEQLEALARGAGLIVIGDSLENDDVVAACQGQGVNHIISDTEDPDDSELVVTSVKLLSGDIFGLEKYLSWGAKISDRVITGYEEKRESMAEVCSYARDVGARRPVVAKIESVVDELLMNALYDAPAVAADVQPAARAQTPPIDARALLRWACDGRYFAVSVEDEFGALHKKSILDHLARARLERGRPRPGDEGSGAGLGLYFILSSVTRFIANIAPGKRTEVVCLFDLKQSGRDAESCTRSLHVFGVS
jgi:hypothetical protein